MSRPAAKRNAPENVRVLAARLLSDLIARRGNLSTLLDAAQPLLVEQHRPLLQELAYGTARHLPTLEFLAAQRLDKPLRNKDHDVHCLILVGLYQLRYMRIAPHAAINETVSAAPLLGKKWARGLVNAVLRSYQRESARESRELPTDDTLATDLQTADESTRYNIPQWLLENFQRAWPEHWRQVVIEGNRRPPMVLRVNLQRVDVDQYLTQLQQQGIEARQHEWVPSAVVLSEPVPVEHLPLFAEGHVSVQDTAAQLAVFLLQNELQQTQRNGHDLRILDACAAPGGKTGHLLEQSPTANLTAVDISETRLLRVKENLQRLGLADRAVCVAADAAAVESWWDGQRFDLIVIDAPCSGTGVIRRQPDIKLLRTAEELSILASMQQNIAESLWPLLNPGGKLLYVTCSVLPEENARQARRLKQRWPDAEEVDLVARIKEQAGEFRGGSSASRQPVAVPVHDSPGLQVLTGDSGMDGFYYWLVEKSVV